MSTYSISEVKARASEILRELDEGDETIITRRGKACGRLTSVEAPAAGGPLARNVEGLPGPSA